MNRYLQKIALLCLLTPLSLSSLAQSEQGTPGEAIVISSGLEGGGYWLTGNRLEAAGTHAGLNIENRSSTGSLSNLKALMDLDNPVNIAFAQADALQFYLQDRSGEAASIETIRRMGKECVFIISGSKSGVKDLADIENAKRFHLGIKSPNSGIRVTFDHMTTLVPQLKHVTVRYGDSVEMINDWVHHLSDIKRAVMVVHAPDAHSEEIDMVIANPDKYRFVKIKDTRLTQSSESGQSAYIAESVAPSAVSGASRVPTICVEELLVGNKDKLSDALQNKISSLSDEQWRAIETGSN